MTFSPQLRPAHFRRSDVVAPFLLDTNAYALLLENPRQAEPYAALMSALADGPHASFYLPEIVSMEIHSLLGKYRRGGNKAQQQACDRHVVFEKSVIPCRHTCVFPQHRRMGARLYKGLLKVITDIEQQRGDLKATVLPMALNEITIARSLLRDFADRFSFGSHDALVAAATLQLLQRVPGLTLVTRDRGLKSLAREVKINVYDPTIKLAVSK